MFKKLFGSNTGKEEVNQNAQNQNLNSDETNDFDSEYEETEYDPETLHGTHYDVDDFEEEVERLAQAWIEQEDITSQSEINNVFFNYRRDVYMAWNQCDSDQYIRFDQRNSMAHHGIASMGNTVEDESNPLLAPVHGIALRDYAAICAKLGSGVAEDEIYKAFGIDATIWGELNTIWPARMAEDTTFSVSVLFGQYFGEADQHPKLQGIKTNLSEEGEANLERLKNDPYFYYELTGARQAAYEYGMDGAQWILDNFGIGLGDFQSVAMKYMELQNQNFDSNVVLHYHEYQDEKQAEYAEKFAAEQGGNVADDVEF
ncbi:DUF6620 family protein [Daejeonella sp.]|uniref:DUF6620 family protein n=1 Tax=Daejeonella sp. TaxID=2805397 RepID=UPI0025C352C3|nr:DUF6620 family protein [Daejeonella sp.]